MFQFVDVVRGVVVVVVSQVSKRGHFPAGERWVRETHCAEKVRPALQRGGQTVGKNHMPSMSISVTICWISETVDTPKSQCNDIL